MSEKATRGITGITISGFKSLRDESHIEVRPLTILAGANSSGKSSIMQPLLLLKQTLEAGYNPGTFLLNGENVKFVSARQMLWRFSNSLIRTFTIGLENDLGLLSLNYTKNELEGNVKDFFVSKQEFTDHSTNRKIVLVPALSHDVILQQLPPEVEEFRKALVPITAHKGIQWHVVSDRSFLTINLRSDNDEPVVEGDLPFAALPIGNFKSNIREIIHVPGLRAKPQLVYPVSSQSDFGFSGTFDSYAASVINDWNRSKNELQMTELSSNLAHLQLSWGFAVVPIDETSIDLQVNPRTQGNIRSEYFFSLTDVGFGVSQVLPVLVALLVAEPGQLVYIEQPELHLHPRAQVRLARMLADAAKRGVRVVAETHSSLLIQGIQTHIAKGDLPHKDVILHWFNRGEDGVTHIDSRDLDEDGAYGDWPEDFADVAFAADAEYLDAVAERRSARSLVNGK